MSRKHTLSAVVFCLFVSLSSPFLFGQATGSFSGTVTDNAGALVTAATVRITSQGTGLTRDTKTDQSGHYLVPLLPIGFYTIQVQAPGFSSVEQKDIRLQVDEQREFNFNLK